MRVYRCETITTYVYPNHVPEGKSLGFKPELRVEKVSAPASASLYRVSTFDYTACSVIGFVRSVGRKWTVEPRAPIARLYGIPTRRKAIDALARLYGLSRKDDE